MLPRSTTRAATGVRYRQSVTMRAARATQPGFSAACSAAGLVAMEALQSTRAVLQTVQAHSVQIVGQPGVGWGRRGMLWGSTAESNRAGSAGTAEQLSTQHSWAVRWGRFPLRWGDLPGRQRSRWRPWTLAT